MDNRRQTRSMTAHSRKSHKSAKHRIVKRQTVKRQTPSLPKTPTLKMPKQERAVHLSDHAFDPAYDPAYDPISNITVRKKPNALKDKLIKFRRMGEQKGFVSYDANYMISTIAFIMLMKKHGSRCIVHTLGGSFNVGLNVDAQSDEVNDTHPANNIQQPHLAADLGIFLRNCIRRGVVVICIPVVIYVGEGVNHTNMLIYRPSQKTVERFEPHGSGETLNEFDDDMNNRINQQLKTLWEVNLTQWLGKVAYVPSNITCPHIRGLQTLENELEMIDQEGEGFCSMWSIFMAELAILNPEKTTNTILKEVFSITKSDPFFIKSIIRGYVLDIERELDFLLKQIGKVGFTYDHDHPTDQLFDTPELGADGLHRLDRWIVNTLHSQNK